MKESGAAGRKRRQSEQDAAQAAERQAVRAPLLEGWRAAIASCGPRPEDPIAFTTWSATIGAELFHQAAVDPALDEDSRRKVCADLLDRLTRAKPAVEIAERLRKLSEAAFGSKAAPAGMSPVPAGGRTLRLRGSARDHRPNNGGPAPDGGEPTK